MFKKFEDLTFADHYMFEKVLHENQDICQELLERLLKIKIDHITYPEIEKTIKLTELKFKYLDEPPIKKVHLNDLNIDIIATGDFE